MRSANSAAALLLSAALGAAQANEPSVRLLVHSAPLAGLRYYAAGELWPALGVGDRLSLEREAGNPHDPNAVAVAWRGRKLGYVPRRDNAALAWGLDRGEPLQARISRLVSYPGRAHPYRARRLEIEVFLE